MLSPGIPRRVHDGVDGFSRRQPQDPFIHIVRQRPRYAAPQDQGVPVLQKAQPFKQAVHRLWGNGRPPAVDLGFPLRPDFHVDAGIARVQPDEGGVTSLAEQHRLDLLPGKPRRKPPRLVFDPQAGQHDRNIDSFSPQIQCLRVRAVDPPRLQIRYLHGNIQGRVQGYRINHASSLPSRFALPGRSYNAAEGSGPRLRTAPAHPPPDIA